MTTEIVALSEVERMAKWMLDSQLGGFKTLPQAVTMMLKCQAEGMHPMKALDRFHIVNGRAVMKAEIMQAEFQAAGGTIKWSELSDNRAEATFTHPQGGSMTIDWDIERAKRAGIYGKDVWKSYGRQMLRNRVVSEGVKTILPGVTAGVYTPEEAADIPSAGAELDVTPPKPATGLSALQARVAELKPVAPPPLELTAEPPSKVTLSDVMELIKTSETMEDLEGAKVLSKALTEGDRAIVRPHWKAKREMLEPPAEASA